MLPVCISIFITVHRRDEADGMRELVSALSRDLGRAHICAAVGFARLFNTVVVSSVVSSPELPDAMVRIVSIAVARWHPKYNSSCVVEIAQMIGTPSKI